MILGHTFARFPEMASIALKINLPVGVTLVQVPVTPRFFLFHNFVPQHLVMAVTFGLKVN